VEFLKRHVICKVNMTALASHQLQLEVGLEYIPLFIDYILLLGERLYYQNHTCSSREYPYV